MYEHPHKFLSAAIWIVGFLIAFYFVEHEWVFYAVFATASAIEVFLVDSGRRRASYLVVSGLALWAIWHGSLPFWIGLVVALALLAFIQFGSPGLWPRRLRERYEAGWNGTKLRERGSTGDGSRR